MIIKIARKIYNTETADLIAETAQGAYGDSTGFEEKLYKRGPADYFLYGHGGEASPYPQPGLFVLSSEDARAWLNRVAGTDYTNQEFGDVTGSTHKVVASKIADDKKTAAKKLADADQAAAKKAAPKKPSAKKVAAEEKVAAPAKKVTADKKVKPAAKEPKAPKAKK